MKKKTKVMDEPRTEVWVLPLEMNNKKGGVKREEDNL